MPYIPEGRLSRRERKVFQAMQKGATVEEAVAQSYNTKNPASVRTLTSKLLRRKRVMLLMDKHGLSDEQLVKGLAEGIKSMKGIVVDKELKKVKDMNARLGYLRTVLKVKQLLERDGEEDKDGEPLIVNAIQINTTGKIRTHETNLPVLEGETIDEDKQG